jgi:hypothetical protein
VNVKLSTNQFDRRDRCLGIFRMEPAARSFAFIQSYSPSKQLLDYALT